jgi:CRISPR-associated protein Cas2
MKDRFMRVIVFFDLPNVSSNDKRNYLKFRKFLINEGFIMMQESVYSRLVLNSQQSELLMNRLRRNVPSKGLIQSLVITEKQYSHIEFIIGEGNRKIIDSEDRLIVL